MVEIEKTAYPRFSKNKKLTEHTLQKIYTPSVDEISIAETHTKDPINKLKFLILLKSFQKLGYFVSRGSMHKPRQSSHLQFSPIFRLSNLCLNLSMVSDIY